MGAPIELLRSRYQRLTLPSAFGAAVGVLLATLTVLSTLSLPPGTTGRFLLAVAVVAAGAILVGQVSDRRALRAFRALCRGGGDEERQVWLAAARECFAYPDHGYRAHFALWCGGSVLLGAVLVLVLGLPVAVGLRMAWVGLQLGPLTAVVTYFLELSPSRAAVQALGLSTEEALRLPPEASSPLRRRLFFLVAQAALSPVLLVLDTQVVRADQALAQAQQGGSAEAWSAALDGYQRLGASSVGVALVVLGAVAVCALAVATSLTSPLREVAAQAARVAAGELTAPPLVPSRDETWGAWVALVRMQAQLVSALSELKRVGSHVVELCSQLATSAERFQESALRQATALTESSATTEELARSAQQIASHAGEVARMAEQSVQAAMDGKGSAEQFVGLMESLQQGNRLVAESVVQLDEHVQRIGRIVDFINGVADTSDLLAVNAELEGFKAGDAGQGFSLIAAEMRRLAESVVTQTREIATLIDEIRDASRAAVLATEAGSKATEAGGRTSRQLTERLEALVKAAQSTLNVARGIDAATQQQHAGTEQLASAMADLAHSTDEGRKMSERTTRVGDDLLSISSSVNALVGRYEER